MRRWWSWAAVAAVVTCGLLVTGCPAPLDPSVGQSYLLGQISGEMADEVLELLRPSPWTGQTDGTLILQASGVQSLTAAQQAGLRALADNGQAVVLIEAVNPDLTALHALLGTYVPMNVPLDPPYDRFSVYVAGQTPYGYRTGSVLPFGHPTATEDPTRALERVEGILAWALGGPASEAELSAASKAKQAGGILNLPTTNIPNTASWSYAVPASWATCGIQPQTCSNNVQQFASAYAIYLQSAQPGQPTDYFIMTTSANVSTSGCQDVYGNRNWGNRIAAYWLRQFNTEAVVAGNYPFSELNINSGPPAEGGYAPQQANPSVQLTTGTSWSLGGSGTVGTKAMGSGVGFSAGVQFTNEATVSYQALETNVNIGATANNASWTYDSWNYVRNSIEPGDHACGNGLNALPGIIYGATFNPQQTWVWQAQPAVRESLPSGLLPVQISNSMLMGWTFYTGSNPSCEPTVYSPIDQYSLSGGGEAYIVGQGASAGITFDVGCNTTTHYGTVPLGSPYYNSQDNDAGNPGTPMAGPAMQFNVPFAPTALATPTPTPSPTSAPGPQITTLSPSSGPAGTVVTITGTNLAGTTQVNFGGQSLTNFLQISSTQVQVAAPAGLTGAALVSVQTAGGFSNTATFTYTP